MHALIKCESYFIGLTENAINISLNNIKLCTGCKDKRNAAFAVFQLRIPINFLCRSVLYSIYRAHFMCNIRVYVRARG